MKLHHWIPALLSAVLFVTPSLAEEQSETAFPWYEVEIIIFTRDLNAARVNEVWPSVPGLPDFANAQPLKWPAPAGQQVSVANMLIPADEYRLKTEFKRLQRSRAIQPVIHQAWRQPVTGLKKAKLFYLRTPEPPAITEAIRGFERFATTEPINLEGTIRVSVNRYLHVEFDLLRRIKQSAPYLLPYEQSFGDSLAPQPQAYRLYRMRDTRRMRSGELHYIDHPLMGVLIKITPYKSLEVLPIKPVETAVIDNAKTEPDTPAKRAPASALSETVTAGSVVEPGAQKPSITTSVVELPARGEE